MITSKKQTTKTTKDEIVSFFSAGSVSRYNTFKWAGLLLLTSILAMLTWAGRADAPTIKQPLSSLAGVITLEGTGSPGSLVEILDENRKRIDTVTVDINGTWAVPSQFSAGNHNLTIRAISKRRERSNPDGDNSLVLAESEAGPITLAVYALPSLSSLPADIPPGPLTLTGEGAAGTVIKVFIDGELVGETVVGPNGEWYLDVGAPNAGDHEINIELYSPDDQLIGELPKQDLTVAQSSPEVAGKVAEEIAESDDSVEEAVVKEIVIVDITAENLPVPAESALIQVVSQNEIDAKAAGTFDSRFLHDSAAISIILDASWSMTLSADINDQSSRLEVHDPNSRFNIARSEIIGLISKIIPENTPVSLRSLGNRAGVFACITDLEYPLQGMKRGELLNAIRQITPGFNTNTPLAAALTKIPNDLLEAGDRERIVILLTDGAERCDGDVEAAITSLTHSDNRVKLNIIGFAVNDSAQREKLQNWAALGKGVYLDTDNASALPVELMTSLAPVFHLSAIEGKHVATGVVGAPPLKITPGTYTLQVSLGDETIISIVEIPAASALQIVVR